MHGRRIGEVVTEAERARFRLIEYQATGAEIIEAQAALLGDLPPYGYVFVFEDGSRLWVTPTEIEVVDEPT